jgi:hypothetical protein
MAKRQYSTKAKLIAELAKQGITKEFNSVATDVRKTFGTCVYTTFGYTSMPTGYEVDIDLLRRVKRATSAIRLGLGALHYFNRNRKAMYAGMTTTQQAYHRRLAKAHTDIDAAITKIRAQYKI